MALGFRIPSFSFGSQVAAPFQTRVVLQCNRMALAGARPPEGAARRRELRAGCIGSTVWRRAAPRRPSPHRHRCFAHIYCRLALPPGCREDHEAEAVCGEPEVPPLEDELSAHSEDGFHGDTLEASPPSPAPLRLRQMLQARRRRAAA